MAERIDSDQSAVRLEMRGICKRFGATVALDDAGIRVASGRKRHQ
ncbi:MAG: hypothetical protein ACYS9C_04435 [Planctomycetota bacterium]